MMTSVVSEDLDFDATVALGPSYFQGGSGHVIDSHGDWIEEVVEGEDVMVRVMGVGIAVPWQQQCGISRPVSSWPAVALCSLYRQDPMGLAL